MAYTNTLGIITLGEEQTPPAVAVELWRAWTTVASDGGSTDHQSLLASSTVAAGPSVAFSIGPPDLSPTAESGSDFISLTVQTPGEPGYLFRSPLVSSLPNPGTTSDFVDIWRTGPIIVTPADLTAGLPPLPMMVNSATTVTSVTVTPAAGGVNLMAGGVVTVGPATPLSSPATDTFTYRLFVVIEPALIHAPATVLVARPASEGTLTFTGTGLGNSILSVVLNALAPFITRNVITLLMDRINATIARAAVSRAVSALRSAGATLPAGGGLPPGVGLSAERVTALPSGLTLWASLHAFGSLRSLLFPATSSPGLNCAVMALAPLLPALTPMMLRRFRDEVLAQAPDGRELIGIYYRHAPVLALRCLTDAALRSAAVRFLNELTDLVSRSMADRLRLERLARRHLASEGVRLPRALRDELAHWLHRLDLAVDLRPSESITRPSQA
ncbi:MAG: hypothetical protein KF686_21345 [Ramlibacter sp.]|nr:hypothetical protein [Ramlibacter sp.]